MTDAQIEELRNILATKYPELVVAVDQGSVRIRGSFPIVYNGRIVDRFLIEVRIPPNFPDELPTLHEIGGRIPRSLDRHTQPDGTSCPFVPEEWFILPREKRTIMRFLDVPVRNFLLFQALAERGEPWPWGERSHGRPGLIQAYGEILGMKSETSILRCLEYLSGKKIKRHWRCHCGSGRDLRRCHAQELEALLKRIPRSVARQALARLQTTK